MKILCSLNLHWLQSFKFRIFLFEIFRNNQLAVAPNAATSLDLVGFSYKCPMSGHSIYVL